MTWHGMAWHGMAWHGMAWHSMAWHGMAWNGMAWKSKWPVPYFGTCEALTCEDTNAHKERHGQRQLEKQWMMRYAGNCTDSTHHSQQREHVQTSHTFTALCWESGSDLFCICYICRLQWMPEFLMVHWTQRTSTNLIQSNTPCLPLCRCV